MLHRITATSPVRFTALSRLLDFVCAFQCERHHQRATIEQVKPGRIALAACCEELLDRIDGALRRDQLLHGRAEIDDVRRLDGRC